MNCKGNKVIREELIYSLNLIQESWLKWSSIVLSGLSSQAKMYRQRGEQEREGLLSADAGTWRV